MLVRRLFSAAILLTLILCGSTQVYGQLGTAGVNGTVTDVTGAVIGGALISIKNKDTGQTREVTSNEAGLFTIQNLPPGLYEVTVEAPDFTTASSNIAVRVGEIANIRGVLKPKGSDEVVEVKAGGVDLTTSQVASFISSDIIVNLPLNGRNFLDLAFLLPGNALAPNFDPIKNNTVDVSSVGQSGRGGNVAVDGADNNNDGVGGVLQNFPQDAVREFQIITNLSPADIGRTGSSAVNIITKSGTNEFHGSGGFFFRNDDLSALPATLDAGTVRGLGEPPFSREQYTASIGGPIKRDRAWFFTAFEYRNQDAIIITGNRDINAQRIVTTFSPAPLNDLLFTARADWQVKASDRMTFRYALQDQDAVESAFLQRPIATPEQRERAFNNY
ncbi:MAG: carboxypeptidase regulatory-like domain-containing protein, partial [Acidobacteriota bacterium]